MREKPKKQKVLFQPIGLIHTPLLDIKPYIQRYDSREDVRSGWQDDISDDIAFSLGKRDQTSKYHRQ